MKLIFMSIVLVLIIALGIAVGANNDAIVEVNYLIAKSSLPLSIVIAISFGAGFIITWLFCAILYLKLFLSRGLLKRKVKKMSSTLEKNETTILKLTRQNKLDADFLLSDKKNDR